MRLLEIERKARSMGIRDTWKFSKEELIRNIQKTEGNAPCFAIGRNKKNVCAEAGCCWKPDCAK